MNAAKSALQLFAMLLVIVAMGRFGGLHGFNAASYHEQAVTATWYCAGEAVNAHADPYRVEPLRSCETRLYSRRQAPWVEPAPLPGYALAAFGLLARLPFAIARTVWFYALIASIVATAFVLARLAGVRPLIALLCLAMVDGYISLIYGELPPIPVAALVAAAAFGSARRYGAAAVCAALAMVEPHVALPGCLAMFVAWPRTRVPFLFCAIVLGALSVATVGVGGNVEYFARVLPVHAASEIAAGDQYSLTRLLHIFGVPDRTALLVGSASYAVMVALGVAVAPLLAARLRCPALVPLYASAVALLGGSFIHDLQIAGAIPAAFLLASITGPLLFWRIFALVALVVVWPIALSGQLAALEAGAAAAAVLAATSVAAAQRWKYAVASAAGSLVLIAALAQVPWQTVGSPGSQAPLAVAGSDLASADWAAYVAHDRLYDTPTLQDVIAKVPVWLGLICLTIVGTALAQPAQKTAGSVAEQRVQVPRRDSIAS